MKLNRIKLAKMLLKFGEVERIDGIKISYEGDFVEGLEMFVEIEGELKPIEDGRHELTDGRIIITEKGILKVIEDKPKEEVVEDKPKEEVIEEKPKEEVIEEKPKEEVKKEKKDLKDEVVLLNKTLVQELEEILKERNKTISELKAKIKEYEERLEMSVQKPAKDAVKLQQIKALKYFIN